VAAGKAVRDINWPTGTLIVGVRRGAKEIVPRGNTDILPGDYIIVLSPEKREKEVDEFVRRVCRVSG
ncbi:MAG TPA: TrkA C-terminal domain-containing protein, partial [Clostridia bacterium]|nr:TrkA C-terminal domain-containing protein [Clostridia bacterium]